MIKTRFAPSPTGFLHLGSARTALFNFLFTRKNKGEFILRIEDTDKERSKPEFEQDIIENLLWLGLKFDGEPIKQSQRLDLYHQVIEELLQKNKAYRCFCSKEKLEEKRQEQILKGEAPRYGGTCRQLSPAEVNAKVSQKTPSVIRLRVPVQKITFEDLLRGEVPCDTSLIGDFVIAKSEAEPLFHLATPIDDHLQSITHIIRGAEHIPNTPKQILVFRAMNWQPPVFAHLPLILGEEGGKLSKRHGAKSVAQYRREGYLPDAIVNFLVLLGWHPKTDKEIMTLTEIIEEFDLKRVQKKAAAFNQNKFIWLSRVYLRQQPAEAILDHLIRINTDPIRQSSRLVSDESERISEVSQDSDKHGFCKAIEANCFKGENGLVYAEEKMIKIVELGKERANTLNDILDNVIFFFVEFGYERELLAWKNCSLATVAQSLLKTYQALEAIEEVDFNEVKLRIALDNLGEDKGLVYWPMRVALTGQIASPPPIEVAVIFGKEYTLKLMKKAIKKISND